MQAAVKAGVTTPITPDRDDRWRDRPALNLNDMIAANQFIVEAPKHLYRGIEHNLTALQARRMRLTGV